MTHATSIEQDHSAGFISTFGQTLRRSKSVIAIAGALLLAGCAETVAPLEPSNTSVRGVELPAELAEVRTSVLELCNTGEGSGEVRQAWTDFGFAEETGKAWIDALAFSGDFGYDDDANAVIYNSTYTYPLINEVSENCLEAAKLVSNGADGTLNVAEATVTLDEFRALPYDPTIEVLAQIAQNLR